MKMKYLRIILWAALTLAASAAFAQNEANRNRLSEIEKMEVTAKKGGPKFDRFGIRLVPEIGYGAHLVRSEDFKSQGLDSGQAYLQALDVFYRPFVWGSVHIGAAIGMDWFKIRDMLFVQDDEHNVMVAPFPEDIEDIEVLRAPSPARHHEEGFPGVHGKQGRADPGLRLRFPGRCLFRALRGLWQVPARLSPAFSGARAHFFHLDGGRLPDDLLIRICGSDFRRFFLYL